MVLRDKYDVGCTEMELSNINYVARVYTRDGSLSMLGCAASLWVLFLENHFVI